MYVVPDVTGPDGAAGTTVYNSCVTDGLLAGQKNPFTAHELVSVYFWANDRYNGALGGAGINEQNALTGFPQPTFARSGGDGQPLPNPSSTYGSWQSANPSYLWKYFNIDASSNYTYTWAMTVNDAAAMEIPLPTKSAIAWIWLPLTYSLPSIAPTNIAVLGTPTASQINLNWHQGAAAPPTGGGYRTVTTYPTDTALTFVGPGTLSTSLTLPFANYHAILRVDGCQAGSSLTTCVSAQAGTPNPVDAWTLPNPPLAQSVPALNILTTSADLYWGQNNNAEEGDTKVKTGEGTHYHVRFTVPTTPPTGFSNFKAVTSVTSDPMTLPVAGLSPNTQYTYTVTTVNTNSGAETTPITETFYTEIMQPNAPTAVTARDKFDLTMSYARVGGTSDAQTYYLITTDGVHSSAPQTSGTSAQITGLAAGTTYNVKTCIKPAPGSTTTSDVCSADTPLAATTQYNTGTAVIDAAITTNSFQLDLGPGANGTTPTGVQINYGCTDGSSASATLYAYATAFQIPGMMGGAICSNIGLTFGLISDPATFSSLLSLAGFGIYPSERDKPADAGSGANQRGRQVRGHESDRASLIAERPGNDVSVGRRRCKF